ncbi:hypothetical protein BC833DRAFT_586287 [Globomyces pollinis-pini]|nr:hypothetical protein BC833DRAFT_586287 [Globomyces pollinis-pini]
MAVLSKSSSIVTLSNWTHQVQERLAPIASSAYDVTVAGLTGVKNILDRYPPLKSLELRKISVHTLIQRGTGIAIVQGTLLAFGAFFLFWWLLAALFFAGVATFWFSASFFGLQVVKKLAA